MLKSIIERSYTLALSSVRVAKTLNMDTVHKNISLINNEQHLYVNKIAYNFTTIRDPEHPHPQTEIDEQPETHPETPPLKAPHLQTNFQRESQEDRPPAPRCYNCGAEGHMSRECPSETICKNCGRGGHIAKECEEEIICKYCKKPGHMAAQCSEASVSRVRKFTCHNCKEEGHFARDCPHPRQERQERYRNNDNDRKVQCYKCHGFGHKSFNCPNQ